MRRLSIRWKLTIWYGGVLTVVLVAFSATVYFVLRHQLMQRIDQGLREELSDVLYEVQRATDSSNLLEWLDRRFARHEGFDFQITQENGERFFVSHRLADKSLPLPASPGEAATPEYQSVSLGESGRWRMVHVNAQGPRGPLTIQVARSLASFDHESAELLFTFWLTGPLTLLVAISGGYFLARRALKPVQMMTQTARQITADRLHQRIDLKNPDDELGDLGQTLNGMIERLERSFAQMRRFTADAAHELRTPLAVMRNETEVALRSPRSADEYCRVLENVLEETNRLAQLADELLFLSRQDAGLQPIGRDQVRIDELLRDVTGNMQLVAHEKGVSLALAENQPCQVLGDASQLRRVFYNLLDNAIKYTAPAGRVVVASQANGDWIKIAVADTGAGISPEHLPRIFDRFYCVDNARSSEQHGAGLGLAICQSIIKGLGGRIDVESAVGQGSAFTVVLPISATRRGLSGTRSGVE